MKSGERLGYFTFDVLPAIGHQLALEGFNGVATVVGVIHHSSPRAPHTELVIEG
jgi:hypothetical protein